MVYGSRYQAIECGTIVCRPLSSLFLASRHQLSRSRGVWQMRWELLPMVRLLLVLVALQVMLAL